MLLQEIVSPKIVAKNNKVKVFVIVFVVGLGHFKITANVKGLWSGGEFETRLPERLPI